MPIVGRILSAVAALALICISGLAAVAQDSATDQQDPEAGANAIHVQQERVEALIATLEDDQERLQLIAQLRLMLEAQQEAQPLDEGQSSGNRMLGEFSRQFDALGNAVDEILETPDDLLDMWAWLRSDVSSQTGRSRWHDLLRTTAICLAAAIAAFILVAIPVRSVGRRLARQSRSLMGKLLGGSAGFMLDALPVIAFAVAYSVCLAALESDIISATIAADLGSVLTIALGSCALVRIVTRPRRPAMRLLPVSDGVARSLTRRLFWIIGVMSAAYSITETLPLIGMPWTARTAFLTVSSLIAACVLIGTILKHRRPVQYAIEQTIRQGTLFGDIVHWLGRQWHLIGSLLVIILLATYIAGGDRLFVGMLGQFGLSLLVLATSLALWRLVVTVNDRHNRMAKIDETDGDLVRRSSHVLLGLIAKLALALAAIGLLIHIWVLDVFVWLGDDAGRDLLEATVTIGVILLLAYSANRAIATVIDRVQRTRQAESAEVRQRRVETLLPLLRSAAAVIIFAVTTLIVLSEVGLDITPLLASAGVIGLAIGFGAQSLVKDVITGLFILMEDAVGVGDVVTVAGYSGVVEEMTIRSIRLRDFGGVVHVIPFGVVDAASNMTRDFSYAVFDVGVSYDSDVDDVMACMNAVDAELHENPELRREILEPIQIVGLDSFGDNAIVIKARIKTRPGQQWAVFRAYNRLLKMRFDERGIEIPFPQMTLHTPAKAKPAPTADPSANIAAKSTHLSNTPGEEST